MRACTTASGGVMFIPDEIARKKCKTSYKKLAENAAAEEEAEEVLVDVEDKQPLTEKTKKTKKKRRSFFGKRKAA